TWCEAVRVLVPHIVAAQEIFLTFSFAPIIEDSGRVAGVMGTCVDVSENAISSRRLATLHRLGSAAPTVRTTEAIGATLAGALRDNVDIPFAVVYLADDKTARALSWIHTDDKASGLPSETATGEIARVLDSEEAI